MHRTILLMVIAALAATFAAGCDPGGTTASPVSSANGLVDETKVEPDPEGAPTNPVVARWGTPTDSDKSLPDDLVVEAENLSSEDFVLSARLVCRGLINKTETLDLGTLDLPAGETISLSVQSADLPIQTVTGFVQARAEIQLTKEGTESERKIVLPAIYYQHGFAYAGIRVLDEGALISESDGKLSGVPTGVSEMGAVIGRVSDGVGGFADVTLMSEEFESKTDGHLAGWETGMDISVGVDEPGEEVAE
ncbi:MAG: hypothetical protein M0R80_17875 [Proteobacteria bacterium]|jgi:hypothetical protein|nr:hypothetical protein [Pseudomonadota bacterium]